MATSKERTTRTFVKEVDGERRVRSVTSPQAEVAAVFDGFTEETPSAKPPSSSTKSAGSSSSS